MKITLILLGLGLAGFAHSETCSLSGAKLARHAYKSGLSFTFNATEGTFCQLSNHKAGGSSASSAVGGVCTFDLFLGKNLSSGWSFSDISYAGENFQIVKAPTHGENNLHIILQLKPKKDGTANFLITGITLLGENCDDWRSTY